MNRLAAETDRPPGLVLALCGGIGGAKLVLGLYHFLRPSGLVVAVNTGDDFEHLGLRISPDIDTVLYTLGGVADPIRGWGRAEETWNFMETLNELGGETWFSLGDRDLAMHIERTRMLRNAKPLSAFVTTAAKRLGISVEVVPATDDPLHTVVLTDDGELPFQIYFVKNSCGPRVRGLRFDCAERALPTANLLETLTSPRLRAIIICPSNPYLSIDPMLAMTSLRNAIAQSRAPVIAVSPIIGGQAVKGPTAKIMAELDIAVNNRSIAEHYRGLIDGLVIDTADEDDRHRIDLPVLATRTLMQSLADRKRLAGEVIRFAEQIASGHEAAARGRSRTLT